LAVEREREATLRVLLKKGEDVEAGDYGGRMAMGYAAEHGYEAGVRILLEEGGVDVNARNSRREPAPYVAAGCGHKEVVRVLLEKGPDVHATDGDGRTPLQQTEDNRPHRVGKLA
jgi:ankyrin repeat protein